MSSLQREKAKQISEDILKRREQLVHSRQEVQNLLAGVEHELNVADGLIKRENKKDDRDRLMQRKAEIDAELASLPAPFHLFISYKRSGDLDEEVAMALYEAFGR